MLVHALTASGAVVGLWGIQAAASGRFRDAFLAMLLAVIIDAVDGALARRFDVARRAAHIDGARLDDIVDYLTYVALPAFVALRIGILPETWSWMAAAAMLLSSAFGFARVDAKTDDAFFTGFPSYWNVVVFYLAAGGLPAGINFALLLVCAALVFVPVGYVYPTRMTVLRTPTLALGTAWGALFAWLIWQYPDVPRIWVAVSLAFPAYYVVLSLMLHRRR